MFKNNPHLYLFRAALLWLLAACCSISSNAQFTNLSGIVNTYHQVIEVIPSKACVRVSSTTGLNTAFKVMLIQMKGASILTADNSAFGDTTALNDAGNYEMAYVCYVNGDTVFLVHEILNTYNTATGKVQLIKVPHSQNATVTDTIKAKPWDNATGTGGVIAISVVDTLILNAPIYADSSGFRGGRHVGSSGTCFNALPAANYIYNGANASPQSGAYKGESIADVTTAQSGGRGAPASGGGGGNNHNNSGGGGANLTAGGIGGGNSSTTNCTLTFRGLPGKALSSWGGKKIFSGGGGGAGHTNGGISFGTGGNGGGIVFITADTLISNGRRISASGGTGAASISNGAGGGGGAGTIIMDVNTYLDNVNIQANGGAGGPSDDNGNNGACYGGGGGGAGGAIYFKGANPAGTVTVTAGALGLETERAANCAAAQPAAAGNAGNIINSYTYRISDDLSNSCAFPLPISILSFRAKEINGKIELTWRTPNPELLKDFSVERMNANQRWESMGVVAINESQENYIALDNHPMYGDNLYRIRMNAKNNSILYSAIRRVVIKHPNENFTIYPNPATDKIKIAGNFSGINQVRLFDLAGKLIFQQMIFNNPAGISLPSLAKGVYLLKLNENAQKLVIR